MWAVGLRQIFHGDLLLLRHLSGQLRLEINPRHC